VEKVPIHDWDLHQSRSNFLENLLPISLMYGQDLFELIENTPLIFVYPEINWEPPATDNKCFDKMNSEPIAVFLEESHSSVYLLEITLMTSA
jgi:hypothetical protein